MTESHAKEVVAGVPDREPPGLRERDGVSDHRE
jgi:hypothetical protein